MKVLVYTNNLAIGGEQIQAIDLAAATRDRGHHVVVAAAAGGPLVEWVASRRVPLIPLDVPRVYPFSFRAMLALRRLARHGAFDLVHAYGVQPTLEAFFGPHLQDGMPVVSSVLTPVATRFHGRLARSLPLITATPAAQQEARRARRGPVYLLEPAVDVAGEHPSADGSGFRRAWNLEDGVPNVVTVSRLERLPVQDKVDGIQRLIQAVSLLAGEMPVRLVIVGTGSAHPELAERAARVNADHGRSVVVMTGPLEDPRPAYAAATVVVGLASSVLRGMAFGKPAIVVGDNGFCEIVTPETAPQFLAFGWWGVGDGSTDTQRLSQQLGTLLRDDRLRSALGAFSRELVCQKYSLAAAGTALEQIYRNASCHRPVVWTLIPDIARTSAWILLYRCVPKVRVPGRPDGFRSRKAAA